MPLANLFLTNLIIAFNVNRFCGCGKLYYLRFIVASSKTLYSYWGGEGKRKVKYCSALLLLQLWCVFSSDFQRDDISWLGNKGDSSLEPSLFESSARSNIYLFTTNIKTQYYFTFKEFFEGVCFISLLEGSLQDFFSFMQEK